jgi:hypothetical protein
MYQIIEDWMLYFVTVMLPPLKKKALHPYAYPVFRIRIRIQLVARIWIRFRNADPDPGGLKRAKMKKKRSKKPGN